MRIILRLNEQRDQDIIYWLNHQENRSEGIREAIRKQIEKEKAVETMLQDMLTYGEDPDPLEQAKKDVKLCREEIYPGQVDNVDDVKRFIGWLYPGDKSQLLDQAWNELYGEVHDEQGNS